MTYQKIKENLVEEKKLLSATQLRNLALKLVLSIFFYAFAIALFVYTVLGTRFAFAVLGLSALAFFWTFDFVCEDAENNLKGVQKFAKFWWTGIIVDIATVIALNIFNFM